MVGAIGGYIYHLYFGCDSAACQISSNPILGTLYGMAVGALIWDRLNPDGEDRK